MITAESFPTPDLALRTNNETEQEAVRAFAARQARVAENLRATLAEAWPRAVAACQGPQLLRTVYADLAEWRYEIATDTVGRLGVGMPQDPGAYLTRIADVGPNLDRFGAVGRMREGSTWDPNTRTYVGGVHTPASRILEYYGAEAEARFREEGRHGGDVLLNWVQLPPKASGRRVELPGNTLLRGQTARVAAEELRTRVSASGRDASLLETGGDPIYAVTAPDYSASTFRGAAFHHIALVADSTWYEDRLAAWQAARYLLYQGPLHKKGSDSCTRVWLVGVGAWLLGRAPVLDHDADLRCMVLGQAHATVHPADAALLAP